MIATPSHSLDCYMDEIRNHPILTRDEERELFERLENGDAGARDRIVGCNLRFVIRIARRFHTRGTPLEDLIQEGNLGLLDAVEKFDWRLGFRFSTYAAFWIRQAIQTAIRQRGSLIRLPVRKARMLGYLGEIMQETQSAHGRAATPGEIAARLKISEEQAEELARISSVVLSLDAPADDDDNPVLDRMADESRPSAAERSAELQTAERVGRIMDTLSGRESRVIRERYGFGSGGPLSLRKISARMGLSQEGVRRIEMRALDKLRAPAVAAHVRGLL